MAPESELTEGQKTDLAELPPSAKLVFKTLQYKGELTQKELCEETQLAPRTVRYAIKRLENHGIVSSDLNIRDARQSFYSISADNTEDVLANAEGLGEDEL